MKKRITFLALILCTLLFSCNDKTEEKPLTSLSDSSLVNMKHLEHLYVPVTFSNGKKAAGIYIYAEAPDYHLVTDSDEGFTCVDDVARAALVYLRNKNFSGDTAKQNKVLKLIDFILEMQSENGYFYNFLFLDSSINTDGKTSINTPGWWSWRALQTLTEAAPIIRKLATLCRWPPDNDLGLRCNSSSSSSNWAVCITLSFISFFENRFKRNPKAIFSYTVM
jgi:hypothetical protein